GKVRMVTGRNGEDVDDDEVVTWWGLVIEGYAATQEQLMAEIANSFGLTPASFDILIRLLRSADSRLPMTRLATEAALSSGGFTKVADRLVAAGLIRREPSETDRRVTYVVLTEHGQEIADGARRTCARTLRRIVLEPLGSNGSAALADAMRTLRSASAEAGVDVEV